MSFTAGLSADHRSGGHVYLRATDLNDDDCPGLPTHCRAQSTSATSPVPRVVSHKRPRSPIDSSDPLSPLPPSEPSLTPSPSKRPRTSSIAITDPSSLCKTRSFPSEYPFAQLWHFAWSSSRLGIPVEKGLKYLLSQLGYSCVKATRNEIVALLRQGDDDIREEYFRLGIQGGPDSLWKRYKQRVRLLEDTRSRNMDLWIPKVLVNGKSNLVSIKWCC